jgi:hypothetical protein
MPSLMRVLQKYFPTESSQMNERVEMSIKEMWGENSEKEKSSKKT